MYRPAKDEPAVTESELSRQLHSSVRTPNLETSLRLLSQGADPNYYHPEKNSTPLQVSQICSVSDQSHCSLSLRTSKYLSYFALCF